MTRSLWKTWRARGAPAVVTGARVGVIVAANVTPDWRGAGKPRRATRAPGFPQAGRYAKAVTGSSVA
jgi:hypothetical protein